MMLSQAAQAMSAKLTGVDASFDRVSIDTRSIQSGDLFVAIRGDRFDGHQYAGAAGEAGACAVVVADDVETSVPVLRVADTRDALGKLAAAWADQYCLKRIAVTGNAGKTTVKEMTACLLGDHVLATEGNLNNDIGVPLTLFRVTDEYRFGVFELGANAPGEIAWTTSLVRPDVAMVTNVTGAHLEGFGSMQGIADAKAEIFSGVGEGGGAVINLDDQFHDYFAAEAKSHGLRLVTVSAEDSQADLYATDIEVGASSVAFVLHTDGKSLPVSLPVPGRHQVLNALMALAAAGLVGASADQCVSRLQALRPVKGRMNLHACHGGVLVDDTYNANPGAVRTVAEWLAAQSGPTLLVLGDIAELGQDAADIMKQVGADVCAAGVDEMLVVGSLATATAAGFGDKAHVMESKLDAANEARRVLTGGGTVLVKGSRSAAMEEVVDHLMETGGQR